MAEVVPPLPAEVIRQLEQIAADFVDNTWRDWDVHPNVRQDMISRVRSRLEAAYRLAGTPTRADMIEPLKRSDDPEEDEAFRMDRPNGYILMTIEAGEMDKRVWQRKERERCAQIVDELKARWLTLPPVLGRREIAGLYAEVADAIRAGGETPQVENQSSEGDK